ncbi:MAG: hypothetical protein GX270_06540 [Clostridiaceae bacterium]|nr:hypothetical protein [Clostridiaceae bacterium]
MKILKLSIKNLKERYFVYIIIALQVWIAVFAFNTSLGQLKLYTFTKNLIANSKLSDSVYICFDNYDFSKDVELYEKYLKKLINVKNIYHIEGISMFFENSNLNFDCFMYSDGLEDNIKYKLSSGQWLSNKKIVGNVNPVIIPYSMSYKYKVGDKITAFADVEKKVKVAMEVVGILEKPEYTLCMNIGGDIDLNDLLSISENTIISGKIKDEQGNFIHGFIQPGRVVTIDNLKNKDATVLQWKNELNGICSLQTIEELKEAYDIRIKDKVSQQMVINFILFLLVTAGLGGNSLLSSFRQIREYSIYYMCGASWKTCMSIRLITDLIVIVTPAVISFAFLKISTELLSKSDLIIDINNFIITLGLIIIVFLISSLIVLSRLYRLGPISIIRRYE